MVPEFYDVSEFRYSDGKYHMLNVKEGFGTEAELSRRLEQFKRVVREKDWFDMFKVKSDDSFPTKNFPKYSTPQCSFKESERYSKDIKPVNFDYFTHESKHGWLNPEYARSKGQVEYAKELEQQNEEWSKQRALNNAKSN